MLPSKKIENGVKLGEAEFRITERICGVTFMEEQRDTRATSDLPLRNGSIMLRNDSWAPDYVIYLDMNN